MDKQLKQEILAALCRGLSNAEDFSYCEESQGRYIQKECKVDIAIIRATIAKLEALETTAERELAIIRATQSAINAAMFEEYGTSTGVRVDPATILECL